MTSATLDITGLRRKIAAIRRESPRALDEVDHRVADGVLSDVIIAAPRDTNRYVRGMAEAANAAGLGPFAVPALRPGKFAAEAKVRLEKQAAKWEAIVRRYEATNREDKWYRRAVKTRDRAREELAKWDPYATIIFGGKGRKLEVTVRNKVYGGTGLRLVRDGRVVYILHNREAHASLVAALTGENPEAGVTCSGMLHEVQRHSHQLIGSGGHPHHLVADELHHATAVLRDDVERLGARVQRLRGAA